MEESFTSGTFGEISGGLSKFHDYQRVPFQGAGYSVLYTVISGERKLFLKALNQEQGSSAENLARLYREYRLLERLYGNEHVVRCIGWREDAQIGPCIVMEYVDGETLADYLKTSPSHREKKRVLNELLDALSFVHNHQVVHNDLKLENILVTRNGHNVKLIDFGYADSDSHLDKATGGTIAFAAPELVQQETTDVTSDIYSLGFIIKVLFPRRYEGVVRKCQRNEASRRFQHVSEVAAAIRRYDVIKWLLWAILVVGLAVSVTVWTWPKHEIEEVLVPKQIVPVLQPDTVVFDTMVVPDPVVPNPVIVEHEVQDIVVIEQAKPVKQETLNVIVQEASVAPSAVNNQATVLNLDSVHQVYQSLLDKYVKTVKDDIADGSLEYVEFATFYGLHFGYDMEMLKLGMMPEEEGLRRVLEDDFQQEYLKLFSDLSNHYSYLPSYHEVVQDENVLLDLKTQWDEEYEKIGESQNKLNEMKRRKFQRD